MEHINDSARGCYIDTNGYSLQTESRRIGCDVKTSNAVSLGAVLSLERHVRAKVVEMCPGSDVSAQKESSGSRAFLTPRKKILVGAFFSAASLAAGAAAFAYGADGKVWDVAKRFSGVIHKYKTS